MRVTIQWRYAFQESALHIGKIAVYLEAIVKIRRETVYAQTEIHLAFAEVC